MWSGMGISELMVILIVWLIPLLVLAWIVNMISRGVKALESIAASLREPKR